MELRLYNVYEKQYEDIEIQTSPQQNSITSHEIENGILTIKAVKAGTVTLYGTKGAVVKVNVRDRAGFFISDFIEVQNPTSYHNSSSFTAN